MGYFGVEGGDFFFLVKKLHRAIQQHMDIDSLVGVGVVGRCLGDLKEAPFETDGVIRYLESHATAVSTLRP